MVLAFESVDEMLKCDHSAKPTEQYFPMVLFIMQYKVQGVSQLFSWPFE